MGHQLPPAERCLNLLLVAIALLSGSFANAALKETAPKGVALTGTWLLDAAKSDDPEEILAKARESRGAEGGRHGGRGGGGGGFGSHSGGMGHGGGMGGGMGGGGNWPQRDSAPDDIPPSSNDDGKPADSAARVRNRGGRGMPFADLAKNPESLAIAQTERAVTVATGDVELRCESGPQFTLEDSQGDAQRQCGWDGRSWSVATTRDHGATRTDRYEASRDGQTLTYTTQISGGRFSKLTIKRVYVPALSAAASSAK